MKKIILMVTAFLVFSMSSMKADASRIIDGAGLLTDDEISRVDAKLDEVSKSCGFDVLVVTTDNPSVNEYNIVDYADDFLDYNGYTDGTVLYLSMSERDYWVSCCGKPCDIIPESDLSDVGYSSALSSGDYCQAFINFANKVNSYACNGGRGPFGAVRKILGALIIGLIAGLIRYLSLKSQLKSVIKQENAAQYTVEGSFNLTTQSDMFMGSNVSKVPIPQNTGTRSGGGGHISSSGVHHTGGGGKF